MRTRGLFHVCWAISISNSHNNVLLLVKRTFFQLQDSNFEPLALQYRPLAANENKIRSCDLSDVAFFTIPSTTLGYVLAPKAPCSSAVVSATKQY